MPTVPVDRAWYFRRTSPTTNDGIVAGDPAYDLEAIALSEAWSVEHIMAITPKPIRKLRNGVPIL
jgi:hypothetical protein